MKTSTRLLTQNNEKILGQNTLRKQEVVAENQKFHTNKMRTYASAWTPVVNKPANEQVVPWINFNWPYLFISLYLFLLYFIFLVLMVLHANQHLHQGFILVEDIYWYVLHVLYSQNTCLYVADIQWKKRSHFPLGMWQVFNISNMHLRFFA